MHQNFNIALNRQIKQNTIKQTNAVLNVQKCIHRKGILERIFNFDP